MNQTQLRELFKEYSYRFNLQGWKLKFNERVSSAGLCSYRTKTIYISKKFLKHTSDENINNTLLHEIAHAIDFERRKTSDHSWRWRNICNEVGCDYTLKHERATLYGNKYNKWLYTCQGCGQQIGTMKKLKNMDRRTCRRCGEKFNVQQIK